MRQSERQKLLEAAKRIEECGLQLTELDKQAESADHAPEVQRITRVLSKHLDVLFGMTSMTPASPNRVEALPGLGEAAIIATRAGASIRKSNDQPVLDENINNVALVVGALQKYLSQPGASLPSAVAPG